MRRRFLAFLDLTWAHKGQGPSIKEIAEHLHVGTPRVIAMLTSMEREGIIVRDRNRNGFVLPRTTRRSSR
jgi:DNA-binding MarR family transcriptional regulator